MNRIISLFLFIFIASCLNAQYNSPIRNKVTLGKQTTADGLVWRGLTSDTANLMTNKLDTSVYLVLDTMTEAMWLYRVTTTPKWNRVVDSLNNMQGILSVAKGGTGASVRTFVDTINTQTVNGEKTFNNSLRVPNIGVGRNTDVVSNYGSISLDGNIGSFIRMYANNTETFRITNNATVTQFAGIGRGFRFDADPQTYALNILSDGKIGFSVVEPTENIDVAGNARIRGNIGAGIDVAEARLHVKGVDVNDNNFALKVDDSGGTNLLSVKNNGDVTLKNPLTVANGGTGATTFTAASRIPYASSATALTTNSNFKFEGDILYIPSAIFNGGTNYGYTFAAKALTSSSGAGIFIRGAQDADTTLPITFGYPYVNIGGSENRLNAIQTIGFGFTNGEYFPPAEIGYITNSVSGNTNGHLVFATRASTLNVAPDEKMRITNAGNVGIGADGSAGYKLDVNGTGRFSSAVNIVANVSAQNLVIQGRDTDNYGQILFYSNDALTRYGYLQSGSTDGGTVALVGDGGGRIDLDNRGLNVTGAATFSSSVTATQFNVTTFGGGLNLNSGDAILDYSSASVRLRTYKTDVGYITPLLINSQTGAATFSGSVTANSLSLTTPLLVENGGTGITSLGSGVATFLGTPSSANLASAVTNETGSGALVFGTSPTIQTATITGGNGNQLFITNAGEDFTQVNFGQNSSGKSFLAIDHRSGFKGFVFGNQVSETDYRKVFFRTNGSVDDMIITNSKVWIGYTTDQGPSLLQVNGTVSANGSVLTSDERFKENITPLNKGLDIVNKLNPVTFNFINDTDNNFSEFEEVGFIAQEVDKALSTETFVKSIVKYTDESNIDSKMVISPHNLIPILTKAIQEQQTLIKALEQRILILENK